MSQAQLIKLRKMDKGKICSAAPVEQLIASSMLRSLEANKKQSQRGVVMIKRTLYFVYKVSVHLKRSE